MLRLALLSARGRLGTFTGALVALIASSALVMAGAMPLESALRTHPPVERYAAAAAVVTGQQIVGADHDVPLGERARVSSALTARLAAVPGVRAAIADVSAPARLGGRATVAHGWGSAALTPYVLTAGRAPAGPDEVVTGYRARLGARLRLASTEAARTVTVVGVARPRRPVRQQTAIFLTDSEATRLAGHPGRVDAIGVLAAPGFDAARLRAAARGAVVLTGDARGKAEYPDLQDGADHADRRHRVVRRTGAVHRDLRRGQHDGPVDPAARARDRAAAGGGRDARPDPPHDRLGGGDRRPRGLGGGDLARGHPRPRARRGARAPRHRPAEPHRQRRLAADRGGRRRRRHGRAARRPRRRTARRAGAADPRAGQRRGRAAAAGPGPRDRRTDRARRRGAAVRRLDRHRQPGHRRGDLRDDGALPRARRSASSGRSWRASRPAILGPPLAGLSPVGGFLASANLRTATRRFSSASTPLVLTVAHELHAAVQLDHDRPRRHPGAPRGPGAASSPSPAPVAGCRPPRWPTCAPLPACARRSRLTPTTLGPSLGVSDDAIPAAILSGGQGGGLDAGVTAGSLADLHGDTIALGRRRAEAAHAKVGDRVPVMLGDGTRTHATVVAIYTRALAFGDALLAPELAAGHQTNQLLGTILVKTGDPAAVARRLRALAARYPGTAGRATAPRWPPRATPTARRTAGSARCSSRSSSPSRRSPWSTRSR